jgi:hypothetical protein
MTRSVGEPDEGLPHNERLRPLTRLASIDASHPLPQGEREENTAAQNYIRNYKSNADDQYLFEIVIDRSEAAKRG